MVKSFFLFFLFLFLFFFFVFFLFEFWYYFSFHFCCFSSFYFYFLANSAYFTKAYFTNTSLVWILEIEPDTEYMAYLNYSNFYKNFNFGVRVIFVLMLCLRLITQEFCFHIFSSLLQIFLFFWFGFLFIYCFCE